MNQPSPHGSSSASGSSGIGRVAGIAVRLHWSTAFIGALAAWFVAALLDAAVGPLPLSVRLSLGVLGALALGASILAHELAHAVAARRCGLRVEAIGLELFGGAAYLLDEPRRPRHAFVVAAVGPATSLAVGAVALGLARAIGAVGTPDALTMLVTWLAVANIALALFNVLPGLPLDGGRMLEAVLWHRRGERAAATITAATVGKGLGLLVLAYGAAGVVVGGFGGLWSMFVGWLLHSAARREQQVARAMHALAGFTVADLMSSPVETVEDYLSLEQFRNGHGGHNARSSYPVRAFSGQIVGLALTASMTRQGRSPAAVDPEETTVSRLMVRGEHLHWAPPNAWATDVVGRGHPASQGRILVGDEHALLGIITPADLARAMRARLKAGERSDTLRTLCSREDGRDRDEVRHDLRAADSQTLG